MTDELLIRHCAPTLAGIKTSNLFGCHYESRALMTEDIRSINLRLRPKGLRALPLQYRKRYALIFLYRPDRLVKDLEDEEACRLLEDRGYDCESPSRCLSRLMERLRRAGKTDFPHEIGLFLGYPPEDVEGFIENQARGSKCAGVWKVYGDEARARAQFEAFQKCTEELFRRWDGGASVEQLAVSQ